MQSFDIQVQDRKTGIWKHRATIDAKTPNAALKTYLPSADPKRGGSRPYTQDGVCTAKNAKGKTFRAIAEVVPA